MQKNGGNDVPFQGKRYIATLFIATSNNTTS